MRGSKIIVLSWLIGVLHFNSWAQSVRQIESKIEKANWSASKQLLQKALHRDSANLQLNLLITKWYVSAVNPGYQIDSAKHYLDKSKTYYQQLPIKLRERANRWGIDENILSRLESSIDSLAFVNAKQINSEVAYNHFINQYPSAKEVGMAIELRNEVAFLDALKVNSYQSFQQYIQSYPQSHRISEATYRYEKLLFEAKTRDDKLNSYISFIEAYPNSPFRKMAEAVIYERSTALGDTASYFNFLQRFPTSAYRKKAIDRLYYLYQEIEKPFPQKLMTDSLAAVHKLNDDYWVPVLAKGKYAFINSSGEEVIPPQFTDVEATYKCGLVESDILSTSEGLFGRNGKKIFDFTPIRQALGLGFWKVGDSTCLKLVHASGEKVISDCVNDIQLIGNRFLFVVKNLGGVIYTLHGKQLLSETWDDAEWLENVLVLTRLEKKTVYSLSALEKIVKGEALEQQQVFDEVRAVGKERLLVRNGSLEGLIDSQQQFIVPLSRQTLLLESFGLVRKINNEFLLDAVDLQLANQKFKNYSFNRQWLLLNSHPNQRIWDTRAKRFLPLQDSSWFAAGLLFAKRGDSTTVYFNSSNELSFFGENKITIIPSRDSVHAFFVTDAKQKKTVYEVVNGKKLFLIECDGIESLNRDLFMIVRKSKKGVINRAGKIILPVEYEAVALNQTHYWSTFKDKKFGLVDVQNGRVIKPVSTKGLSILNKNTLIVFKDGFYGLMDWNGKSVTEFVYDEILPWKENAIWVKKNFSWTLFDYVTSKVIIDRIKRFDTWLDGETEKLYRIQRENFFGVISSSKGVIIPPTFSMILNVGSDEVPLYFTDKEVEEAGVHVVIYYNQNGKFLRKQVYEDEEFEQVVCEQ